MIARTRSLMRPLLPAVVCCTVMAATLPRSAVADPILYTAGDVACDPVDPSFNAGNGTATACRQNATAGLMADGTFDAVLALGDLQYQNATLTDFQRSYAASWGRLKAVTFPVLGNHEGTVAASGNGYCVYFGAAAHCNASGLQGGAGFYSFDLGAWHVVVLNSNCDAAGGCDAGSAQYQWLASDLAANRRSCTLAAWHHPRWTSDGPNQFMQPIWQLFYASGGDLVLSGHTHYYERFAPIDGTGALNASDGMRSFVVGTGGVNLAIFGGSPAAGSEVRENTTFGVLRLVLHPTSYDWNFVPGPGPAFADSGSQSCRQLLDVAAPSPPGALSATAKGPAVVALSWTGSVDNVGVAGYEIWRGPPSGPMAPMATTGPDVAFVDTTVAARTPYRYQVRARDTAGNMSDMSNVGSVVTPAVRGALLKHWRLKAVRARRALARGRIRIPARRWAPTVIEVRVAGRLAARRQTRSKRAVTLKLASWSKRSRYRHRAVTVTIRAPA